MRAISLALEAIRDRDEEQAKEELHKFADAEESSDPEGVVEKINKALQKCTSEDDQVKVREVLMWTMFMRYENPELDGLSSVLNDRKWNSDYLEHQVRDGILSE